MVEAGAVCTVVVLGDLGRSPRMCFHIAALASAGYRVEVLAYTDTDLPAELVDRERIRIRPLKSRPVSRSAGVVYLVSVVPVLIARFTDLAGALLASTPSQWILVQNPPALPALPLLLLVARLRGARVVVDWHNFGWTILGVRLGQDHSVVSLAGRLERVLARMADFHLCVSEAMRRELSERYGMEATVFHDRPAQRFLDAAGRDRAASLDEILSTLDLPKGEARDLMAGRAKLIVSSTSWSADEDFSLLLDAMKIWSEQEPRPHLVVVVSGLGPMREVFWRAVESAGLAGVSVRTVWFSDEIYPSLLAAADLGVCVHRSSSRLDLPMKLADMAGAGLPACAFDYGRCVGEALRDGEEGFLFRTAEELAEIWKRVLVEEPEQLARIREVLRGRESTWQENWTKVVAPLLGANPEPESAT